ncbi:MAG TPA: hypothetical protein VIY71_07440 [Solirubrobacterales bacterium]
MRMAVATAVNRWTATPLRIETLNSKVDGMDGEVVAEVLRSAITRLATLGPLAPKMVATPFVARQLLNEVADAVSDVPEGRLVAPIVSLFGRLIRRDELRLRGAVLFSKRRGPGLSLSLVRANGELVDSLTIWVDEYEPRHVRRSDDDKTDIASRMIRVTTAAAVWTHFAILRFRLSLPDDEYRAQLGTPDWQSYAFLRTGAQEEVVPEPEPLARALFARAIDVDPCNFPAQFNLASMEAFERLEKQAADRLEWLHQQLEPNLLEGRAVDSLLSDRSTLDHDPLRFQISSVWASVAINRYFREAEHGTNFKGNPAEESLKQLLLVWDVLTEDLVVLEAALAILEPDGDFHGTPDENSPSTRRAIETMNDRRRRRRRRGEKSVLSRSDSEQLVLNRFLTRLEPPMLMRWAMMGMEIGRHAPDGATLSGLTDKYSPADLDREKLARGLHAWTQTGEGRLTPEAVIEHFVRVRARLDGTTRYELACYYAQIEHTDRALEELRHSLSTGEHRSAWADGDPQLTPVTTTSEYKLLLQEYFREEEVTRSS